eukprot:4696860-Prorocentrum_lima.AAC.1
MCIRDRARGYFGEGHIQGIWKYLGGYITARAEGDCPPRAMWTAHAHRAAATATWEPAARSIADRTASIMAAPPPPADRAAQWNTYVVS